MVKVGFEQMVVKSWFLRVVYNVSRLKEFVKEKMLLCRTFFDRSSRSPLLSGLFFLKTFADLFCGIFDDPKGE